MIARRHLRSAECSAIGLQSAAADHAAGKQERDDEMMLYRTKFMAIATMGVICATAALAADAGKGRQIAERWCSSCHLVSAEQASAIADVPSFMSLGRDGRIMADRLSFLLLEPHPQMPAVSLSRDDVSDLAAYIKTFSTSK
jgi:mono/diheme cytochrome c family protein